MNKKEMFELTNPQKSIWMMEQYYKGTNINNICATLIINADVDIEKLNEAINIFIQNNKSFGLNFCVENGELKQYFTEIEPIQFECVNLKDKKEARKFAEKTAEEIFNVEGEKLFKFKIFRLENNHGGFVVMTHHLISDAATMGLVGREIAEIYEKLIFEEEIEHKDYSYNEYIIDEKEYLNSPKFNKDKEYWITNFKDIPEVATIPTTSENLVADLNGKSAREEFIININLLTRISKFCSQNKISIFNFFMAVYAIYLSRVSNLKDFVIGTPILNRTNFKEKHTTGMFINTAPLRIKIDNNIDFISFVKNIAQSSMAMLRYQKYSYQSLLEELRKTNNELPTLYDVMLSYQVTKASDKSARIPYETDWIPATTISNGIYIHLHDNDDSGTLNIDYDYQMEKYKEQDIKNLHNRILHVINQVLENETCLEKDIEIVTSEEKYQILNEFNNTYTDYPRDKTIVDLFEEQVEKTPDNIAVVFNERNITYKELNEKANGLANYLIENYNIQNQEKIGIFLDKSLESIVAILAIIKTGAVYVPIDIKYPKDRIEYILQDTKCRVTLTDKKHETELPEGIHKINIELTNQLYKDSPNSNIEIKNNPEDLIYIMYTSGSTGKPKGVMIKHRNVVRLVKNTNYINLSECKNILQTGSIVFDACTFEIWGALLNGLSLYMLETNDLLTPNTLEKYLKLNKIDTLWITAPLFNQLSEKNPKMFNTVKHLLTGGDVLSPKHINMVKDSNPDLTIINGYGPTENTTFSCCFKIDKKYKNCIPIGKPISNSTAYVVSQNGSLQPIGVKGELWVGGDGVGKGYLNREDLTSDKFIKNPFAEGMIYKTGDIVELQQDGNIKFIGRIDNQVKIRGFRVELSEINNSIAEFKGITKVYTIITEKDKNKYIVTYFTSNKTINVKELTKYLKEKLPAYMIPSSLIQMQEFPLNVNGKIDKNKLPKPNMEEEKRNIVRPRNEKEEILLGIYEEVLQKTEIGTDNNFFELGGDSLTAIKLITKISEKLKVQIGIKDIFENPTIIKLAEIIENIAECKEAEIEITETKEYYPTSSAQKRMYYSTLADGEDSILYNISGGIILDKAPDIERLDKAFNKLINQNSALRTCFEVIDGELLQKIQEEVEFKLEYEEVPHSNIEQVTREFIKPFDLSKAPLIRAKAITMKNKKTLLLIDMHHIISDGETVSIIAKELSELYNGKLIKEKEIEYKDFAVWESKEEFKKQEEYWLSMYNDEIPTLELPTNYSRPAVQSFEGNCIEKKLNNEIVENINNTCKRLGITPYMFLIGIYYILLAEYSAANDIVIGTPVIGRHKEQLENIIGMFVNTLALRNKIKQEESFEEFISKVKENCLKAFENQDYPFDKLIKKLNLQKEASRSLLFDVLFTYHGQTYPTMNFEGIEANFYMPKTNISKFDISLEAVLSNEDLSLRFEYCSKLFSEDFIDKMAKHYINILKFVLKDTSIQISNIDMISRPERKQIIDKINNTEAVYEKDKTVSQLFEEQVEKTPNKTAVVFEDGKLTYRELNNKANQLANYMKVNYGIKHNDNVAIFVKKSFESIISILATIKLGATFVPIDIDYPQDRIDYILQDSKAKLILTMRKYEEKLKTDIPKEIIDIESSAIYSKTNKSNPANSLKPEDNIYIMYTSGTTGRPKGVIIKHRNVVRLVRNTNYIDFSKCSRILQTGSIVFDACTFEIWGALLNGLSLYIIKKDELLDTKILEKYLADNKIDTLWLTAPLFNQLSEENPNIFNEVKFLLTGGDVLSPRHINMVRDANSNITIINGYGPTENTTFSCCFTIDKKYDTSIPIGRPIANSTAYIVSKNGKIQPEGVPGELWVGGDGVGKGYLNREDLTAEKFIKNPFGEGKIYKTGDLVKLLPSGDIDFIGRIDKQVKIRGFRVEISEIDNVFKQYPGVSKLFTSVNETNGNKMLITYFTADRKLNIQDILLFLQERLPLYMIPQYIMQLDALPLTINGKVDKAALPMPEIESKTKYVAHENEIQKQLCDIWCKLFGMKRIGIMDNFFELGGDSLLAIKLQTEALKQNININYSDVFEYQNIKSLSEKKQDQKLYYIDKNYDYSKINELIKINNICNIDKETTERQIGNLLLFGATGFLGAHILDEYLSNSEGNIYCLVRRKNNEDSVERLKNILNFYFENKYDDEFGKRIFVVYGDITKQGFGLSQKEYKELGRNIDVVVNSAALVKHFGDFEMFKSINVIGTKNIIKYCKDFNKKLYHVSTMSVAGISAIDEDIQNDDERILFGEDQFYIGQNLNNPYVYTKFQAEKEIFEEIQNGGLEACVLRMGNIFNRVSDGRFQINVSENAYVNRIKSILKLGTVQNRFLSHALEFTPVDSSAEAILTIIKHNPKFNILHLFDTKFITFPNIIAILKNIGYKIELANDEEFAKQIKKFLKDENLKNQITGLIPDLKKDKTLALAAKTLPNAYFTTLYLKSIGFEWPEIDKEYVEQFIEYFRKIGYIE